MSVYGKEESERRHPVTGPLMLDRHGAAQDYKISRVKKGQEVPGKGVCDFLSVGKFSRVVLRMRAHAFEKRSQILLSPNAPAAMILKAKTAYGDDADSLSTGRCSYFYVSR